MTARILEQARTVAAAFQAKIVNASGRQRIASRLAIVMLPLLAVLSTRTHAAGRDRFDSLSVTRKFLADVLAGKIEAALKACAPDCFSAVALAKLRANLGTGEEKVVGVTELTEESVVVSRHTGVRSRMESLGAVSPSRPAQWGVTTLRRQGSAWLVERFDFMSPEQFRRYIESYNARRISGP